MGRLIIFLTLLFVVATGGQALAGRESAADAALQAEVARGLEKILDLWRDGHYEDLYDHTYGGRETMEHFTRRMANAPRRPACCWEKLRDAKVTISGENGATLRGRIGLEEGGAGESYIGSLRMVREDGVWKAARKDIISLAGGSKKKKRQYSWR
jgi:hypothetical protein